MNASERPALPLALRILHWIIIANFAINVFYTAFQVFIVLLPEGMSPGPLWGRAADLPTELVVKRRLYAIECWVTIGGLATYLAITEYLPRLLRKPLAAPAPTVDA